MKNWTTKDGDDIPYKKLKDDHLLNILKWIERRAENGITIIEGPTAWCDEEDMWGEEYEIEGDEVLERYDYKGLLKEAKKRKLNI